MNFDVEFGGSVASPITRTHPYSHLNDEAPNTRYSMEPCEPEVEVNRNISSNRPLATMTTTTPINHMIRPGALEPNLTQTLPFRVLMDDAVEKKSELSNLQIFSIILSVYQYSRIS